MLSRNDMYSKHLKTTTTYKERQQIYAPDAALTLFKVNNNGTSTKLIDVIIFIVSFEYICFINLVFLFFIVTKLLPAARFNAFWC